MSVKEITLACDVPECRAWCRIETTSLHAARQRAAERSGWTRGPGGDDICGPCTRGEEPLR